MKLSKLHTNLKQIYLSINEFCVFKSEYIKTIFLRRCRCRYCWRFVDDGKFHIIYQNRHIRIIIFNNLHSHTLCSSLSSHRPCSSRATFSVCAFPNPCARSAHNDSFQKGIKSIQIMAIHHATQVCASTCSMFSSTAMQAHYMWKWGGSGQIQCVFTLTKTDNRWTHACLKNCIYCFLFQFRFLLWVCFCCVVSPFSYYNFFRLV